MRTVSSIKQFCVFIVLANLASLAAAADSKKEPTAAETIAKSGQQTTCVFANTIYDWQTLDERNLVIWAPSRRNAYLVTFSMPLIGIRNANNLAFIDHNRDGRLCAFGMDAIGTDDRAMPQKSTINTITRLDDASIAQLEAQYKTHLSRGGKKKIPPQPSGDSAK